MKKGVNHPREDGMRDVADLLENLTMLVGIAAGANKRKLARFLGVQNKRVTEVSKLFSPISVRKTGVKAV